MLWEVCHTHAMSLTIAQRYTATGYSECVLVLCKKFCNNLQPIVECIVQKTQSKNWEKMESAKRARRSPEI